MSAHRPAEETNDPLIADQRNFYKVEKWTKDCSAPLELDNFMRLF